MQAGNVFLVTGATGYIGSRLVRALAERNAASGLILPVRDRGKAGKMYAGLAAEEGLELHFVEAAAEDPELQKLSQPIDYIIHCASVTQSAEMIVHPVETADGIVLGTRNLLELARRKRVKSMVCLSSMEVYGAVPDCGRPLREDELGMIDLMPARSCYPQGKRMAEHYCYIYQQEYGVPVKIARLAQTFGRGVRPDDGRVYMQFARAALEGRDIVLKTAGQSMGNYCAADDTINAILTILDAGADGEVYNVVNEANTMRIREMAELVAGEIAGGTIHVRVEPENAFLTGYAPDTGLRLSAEKLRGLGWRPEKGLAQMYREVMRELENFNVNDRICEI